MNNDNCGFEHDAVEGVNKGVSSRVPVIVRDDGFSEFFYTEPGIMSKDVFLYECVDYLKDYDNVAVKEFGLGPGSVFTFDTRVGELFLEGLNEEQKKLFRKGDLWVAENVRKLIESGSEPLKTVVERCHEMGLKVWARLEMNHEYGPQDEKNYLWVGFVGSFNKNHPEYRIGNSVLLDFRHKEVRDFKLAILREAAQRGVDGISMDFCVYPPFLSAPERDACIMTQFIRDMRHMLNEEGKKQNKKIDLIARVQYDGEKIGLEWRKWIREELIDVIIPSVVNPSVMFDVPVEEFVAEAEGTKCKVYGCIRPHFGMVTTDSFPGDEEKRIVRKERPVTAEMYSGKAMLLLKSGVNGMQIALGSGDRSEWLPLFNHLGDESCLYDRNKEYYVNRKNQLPLILAGNAEGKPVYLRIGDDLQQLREKRYKVGTRLVIYCRGLKEEERLEISVNRNQPLVLSCGDLQAKADDFPIEEPHKMEAGKLFSIENWWEIGRNELEVEPDYFKDGCNIISFKYMANKQCHGNELRIADIYLKLSLSK